MRRDWAFAQKLVVKSGAASFRGLELERPFVGLLDCLLACDRLENPVVLLLVAAVDVELVAKPAAAGEGEVEACLLHEAFQQRLSEPGVEQ